MRFVPRRYTSEQLRNARVLAGASRRPIIRKAILEAGLVESTLRNLPYGDRDSEGILQQRESQGWGSRGESVATDASQFVRAAKKVLAGGFRGSAGELAQAVQRSAFPGRYHARSGEADALLRSVGGGGGSGGSAPSLPELEAALPAGQGSTAGADAIAALLSRPQAPPVSAAVAPAHSARAVMPQGYAPPVSSGAPAQERPDVEALLAAVRTQGGELPASQPADAGGGVYTGSGGTRGGKLSEAHEIIYRGPGGSTTVDKGRHVPEDTFEGHDDHVHLAAGPKTTRALARVARDRFGLHISELEPFDKVDPVHVKGSYHYSGRAFDASGDPRRMAAFARYAARRLGAR